MKKMFENITKISRKEYDIFLDSYKKEYEVSENIYLLLYICFFGLCMIFAFIEKEIILGIALLIGISMYIWIKIIRPTHLVEKTKSQKLLTNYTNQYEFYNSYFEVQNSDGKSQVLYFKLYRVVETKNYFYIYISRQYAFIVSKFGFTEGKVEDFSNFIKKKVYFKYKNRIK